MNEASAQLFQGEELLHRRLLQAATQCFNNAQQLGADEDRCSAGRWTASMLRGDFSSAWRESDAIRSRGAFDPNQLWCGDDISGKRVIVRCLHGYGDAVQFLRYIPLLRSKDSDITVQAEPRFVPLIQHIRGIDKAIPWDPPGELLPEWDVQVEIMELPYLFRTTVDDLPITVKYIQFSENELFDSRAILRQTRSPNVGVVWSAGEWNLSRSVPVDLLKAFFQRTDCVFWNLQGGHVRTQWHDLPFCPNLHDPPGLCDTPLSLATFIAELDLVITVDTLAAHLAGALGVPAWVLLQYAADWRWMTERPDSPWYPSLLLFRQRNQGNWAEVVRDVFAALDAWLSPDNRKRKAA